MSVPGAHDGIYKEFEIDLDLKRPGQYDDIMLVEGDTTNRFIINLVDHGEPIDLTGRRVMCVFSHGRGTAYQDSYSPGSNIEIKGNRVTVLLNTGSFSEGLVECELKIYGDPQTLTQVTTSRFNFMCRKGIMDEKSFESNN